MPNPLRGQKALSALLAILVSSGCVNAAKAADNAAEQKPVSPATGAATPTTAAPATAASSAATPASANPAATPAATAAAGSAAAGAAPNTAAGADANEVTERVPFKPGQALTTATDTEDIIATYDVELAKKQCAAYPDSPEASFILAVALTRTSRVEEALKEVQRARKLAESKGGPVYFDKMITSYEEMLKSYPDDNRVRFGLAWAYYMKAYMLAEQSRRSARWKKNMAAVAAANKAAGKGATAGGATAPAAGTPGAATAGTPAAGAVDPTAAANMAKSAVNNKDVVKALSGGNPAGLAQLATAAMAMAGNQNLPPQSLPHIPTALEKAEPADVPMITRYYELALSKLDEIVKREPDDVWTIVYRAHLKAEYTGDLEEAMKTWKAVESKHPNNPAPYFFLGEGYLKQGNLKESINHVSKAIALRALGN